MRDKMLDDVTDVLGSKNKRIDELEAALRKAEAYIELVGGFGEGGTSEYEVTLDAVRQALRGSRNI